LGKYDSLADLVLVNGKVVTVNNDNSVAEAVAVKMGRIVKVGTSEEIGSMAGEETQVIDLRGRVVMPGLTDAHVHMIQGGTRALDPRKLDCRDFYYPEIKSIEDIINRMGEHAKKIPKGEWVMATGSPMADMRLTERRFPDKHDLDKATVDHPAYISFGAHITIANSLALKVANVTKDTPNPIAGIIFKDESGEPTGLLRESSEPRNKPSFTRRKGVDRGGHQSGRHDPLHNVLHP
jgi:hypothetical protein